LGLRPELRHHPLFYLELHGQICPPQALVQISQQMATLAAVGQRTQRRVAQPQPWQGDRDDRIGGADEPTGNLDADNGNRVMELLLQLQQQVGSTVLMATHSMEIAAQANRILRLEAGQIRELAP